MNGLLETVLSTASAGIDEVLGAQDLVNEEALNGFNILPKFLSMLDGHTKNFVFLDRSAIHELSFAQVAAQYYLERYADRISGFNLIINQAEVENLDGLAEALPPLLGVMGGKELRVWLQYSSRATNENVEALIEIIESGGIDTIILDSKRAGRDLIIDVMSFSRNTSCQLGLYIRPKQCSLQLLRDLVSRKKSPIVLPPRIIYQILNS